MALTIIPLNTKPFTTQRVTLSGRAYELGKRWNMRDEAWYLSLTDSQGLLLAHQKMVLGIDLLRYLRGPRVPPGLLISQDRSGSGRIAGLDDLGTRVILCYITPAVAVPAQATFIPSGGMLGG